MARNKVNAIVTEVIDNSYSFNPTSQSINANITQYINKNNNTNSYILQNIIIIIKMLTDYYLRSKIPREKEDFEDLGEDGSISLILKQNLRQICCEDAN
jgi:hypothetical protein